MRKVLDGCSHRYLAVRKGMCGERRVGGKGWGKRGWYLTLGDGGREELENGGKYLTDGESKGSLGNFNCFES